MLAVGEHLLGGVNDQTLRMTTGFSGGVGLTHQDICGALSSAIIIIGAQYGRTQPTEDDRECQTRAAAYRAHFEQQFGSVYCHALRAEHYGTNGREPCAVLVEQAARLLMSMLAEKNDDD